jgi:hypothetical protein
VSPVFYLNHSDSLQLNRLIFRAVSGCFLRFLVTVEHYSDVEGKIRYYKFFAEVTETFAVSVRFHLRFPVQRGYNAVNLLNMNFCLDMGIHIFGKTELSVYGHTLSIAIFYNISI